MFQIVLNIHTHLISLFLGFWDIWDIDQMEPNCTTIQGTMKNSVMKHVPTLKVHFLNVPGHSNLQTKPYKEHGNILPARSI
jgi:hypothetical protein